MLKPLTEPGAQSPQWPRNATAFFQGGNVLLSTTNPYPASTIRMIDMMYDPEFSWQILLGSWDLNLQRLPDGKVDVLDPPQGLNVNEWRFNNSPALAWPYALLQNVREAWPEFVKQLKNIGINQYLEIHQAAYDRYAAN